MKPDHCTSLNCSGPCTNCRCSHAIYVGSGFDEKGKYWRWEFNPWFGPLFLTAKGESMKKQPGSKSPAWSVFEKWQKEKGV